MRIKKRYILGAVLLLGLVVYFVRRRKREALQNPYTGSASSEEETTNDPLAWVKGKAKADEKGILTPYTGSGTPGSARQVPSAPPPDPVAADPYTGSGQVKGTLPGEFRPSFNNLDQSKNFSKIGSNLPNIAGTVNSVDTSKIATPNLALPDMKKSVNTYIPGKDVV
jgi:hypothetical protein